MSQSQSQTQISNAQRDSRATSEVLTNSRKQFIGSLIARNNSNDEDQGVHKVLDLLGKENFPKAVKSIKVKKDELIATLGFLNYLSFESAQERFKKLLVEGLIEGIMEKYRLLTPDICRNCQKIYEPDADILGDNCFICKKTMCPACCPILNENDEVNKILFPICSDCCSSGTAKPIDKGVTPPKENLNNP